MSARRTASAVFSLILLVTLVVPSTGCRLCGDCDMDAYPAYGGAWERTLRETGRVGSVFDPGGVRAADIEARTDPEAADRRIRAQSRYDNDGSSDSGEDRQKKSDDEQRKLDEETRGNDKTPEQEKADLEELEKRLEGLNLQDIRYVEPRENQSDWNQQASAAPKTKPLCVKFDPRKLVGPFMALLLFGLAVRLLIGEAQKVSWDDFVAGLTGVPTAYLIIATFLVALNYGLLICYDILALRYVCRPLPLRRVSLVAFLGYALGNNLGTLLAAAPIRYRFYHRWGLTHRQIVALMSVLALTFWSGVCVLGGVVLVLHPIELPAKFDLPFGVRTLGAILLSIAVFYAIICLVWHKPWPIGKLHLRPPSLGLATAQASVAIVDLTISATALYLVMPGDAVVPFPTVLAAYLVGITVSLITQVPGGLGVLELILWTLLADTVGKPVIASVLIFRVIYYILPLLVGMVVLVAHEIYSGAMEARHDAEAFDSTTTQPFRLCGQDGKSSQNLATTATKLPVCCVERCGKIDADTERA